MLTERGKHPSWFKMRVERRDFLRSLPPQVAVNVLLLCLDYLEQGEPIEIEDPLTRIAFSAFSPDVIEAWTKYLSRVENGRRGGRIPKNDGE